MSVPMEDALAVVRAAYGEQQWAALSPQEQTHAIYREMRRLQLEHITRRGMQIANGGLNGGDALRCSVLVKTRTGDRCSWQPVVVLGGRAYCGLHDPRRWRPDVANAARAAHGMRNAAE
ncbi:MAG: hypothetical protein J0H67_22885 [Rhodospirillales bacterium]|nr:hypothetical protein [Rhodospirillales bacterium]MBN8897471.1 hypothetical protein [Rhodospirillales bacterium]